MADLLHTIGGKIAAAISGLFLLFSGGAHTATNTQPNVHTAAAVVATTQDPFHPTETASSTASGTSATTTIVNNYITQPVITRDAETSIDEKTFKSILSIIRNDLALRLSQMSATGGSQATNGSPFSDTFVSRDLFNKQVHAIFNSIALVNRIDQLSRVTLSNATVSGVAGLTDADIPDGITASNYLALTGGTLSGNLTINGNFTLSGTQSLSGALTIPYLTATSSTASSFVQASSTRFSIFDTAYFGGTSTTTINSTGSITLPSAALLTAPYASSTALTVSGTGYFGTASTTNFTVSSIPSSVPYTSATGAVSGASLAATSIFVTNGSSVPSWTTTLPAFTLGGAVTGNSQNIMGLNGITGTYASTTRLSVFDRAWFGGSATSTFDSAGRLGILTASPNYPLEVTGAGRFSSLVDASHFVATSTSATSTFAGPVSMGNDTIRAYKTGKFDIGDFSMSAKGLNVFTNTAGVVASFQNNATANGNAIISMNSSNVTGNVYAFNAPISSTGNLSALLENDGSGNAVYEALVLGAGDAKSTYSINGGQAWALGLDNSDSDSFKISGNASLGTNDFMAITTSGNVGIATTSPQGKLHVSGGLIVIDNGWELDSRNAAGTAGYRLIGSDSSNNTLLGANAVLRLNSGAPTDAMLISSTGNVGIGTANPQRLLHVLGGGTPMSAYAGQTMAIFQNTANAGTNSRISITAGNAAASIIDFGDTDADYGQIQYNNNGDYMSFLTTGTEKLRITTSGNVGIGTSTPWRTLSVAGTVGFDGLTGATGAGSLCLDSNKQVVYNSGSDACLSSTRATKHDIQNLNLDALALISSLQPVSFVYNNDASSTIRYGFIAEDTAAIDSHLATYDQRGAISGIDDRSIISVLVEAVQSLIQKVGDFAERIGTKELIAVNVEADHVTANEDVCIKKSNGSPVCITGEQLETLLSQSGQQSATQTQTPAAPEPTSTTETESASARTAISERADQENFASTTGIQISPDAETSSSESVTNTQAEP